MFLKTFKEAMGISGKSEHFLFGVKELSHGIELG
jgi:hypothetical protein